MINRTEKERDDIIFAIKELHKFYAKPVPEPGEIKFWMKGFSKYKTETVVDALELAPAECKYFPRPFDVVKIINAKNGSEGSGYKMHEAPDYSKCDPKIAYAWSRFIKLHSDWSLPTAIDVDIEMTDEEVIEFCNIEARKKRMPEAIPAKYKLDDFWQGYEEKSALGSMGNLL